MKTLKLFLILSFIISSSLHAMDDAPSAPVVSPVTSASYNSAPPPYDAAHSVSTIIKGNLQKAVKDFDRDTLITLIDDKSALILKDQRNAQLAAEVYAVALVGTNQKLLAALTKHAVPAPNEEFLTLLTRDILKLHGRWSIEDASTKKRNHTYPITTLEWCLDNGADANGVTQGKQTKTPGFPYNYEQPDKTTNTHPLGILLEVMAFPCHMKSVVETYALLKTRGATLSDEQALKVLEYWQSSPLNFGSPQYPDYRMTVKNIPSASCALHQGSYSASECNAFNLIKAAYILLLDKKDLNMSSDTAAAIRSALRSYSEFSNPQIRRYLKPIVKDDSNEPTQPAPTSFFSSLMRRLTPQPAPQVQPVANTYDDLCNLPLYKEKTQYFIFD